MKKKSLSAWWVWLFLLFLWGAPLLGKENISVKDIITLKKLGYTDQDILKELKENKVQLALKKTDIEALKKAGIGKKVIEWLIRSAPKQASPKITWNKLLAWLKEGRTVDKILLDFRQAQLPALTPKRALELIKKKAPLPILLYLKQKTLNKSNLEDLLQEKTSLPVIRILCEDLGLNWKPAPKEALALIKKGLPGNLVRKMVRGEFKGNKRKKPFIEGSHYKKEEGESGFIGYEHIGREFRIPYPKGWKALRSNKDGNIEYLFTPDLVQDPEKAIRGFTFQRIFLSTNTSFSILSLNQIAQKSHLLLISSEPGLKAITSFTPFFLGGKQGLGRDYVGRLKKKKGDFWGRMGILRDGRILYLVNYYCPLKERDKFQPIFERMAKNSRLGLPKVHQRTRKWEAHELVQKYKKSVVCVIAGTEKGWVSSGSGFIIRKDGYVVTNHHVVWNSKEKKFFTKFLIAWDASLNLKPVYAYLVGAKREYVSNLVKSLTLGGADIALLKIMEPGNYQPVRLTPLHEIALGDPVVAMGFPRVDLFVDLEKMNLSIFVTKGGIVRFNRDDKNRVKSIYTDAKITHGNSGGPCFDLNTGGVFGINTFGAWHGIETDIPQLKNLQLGDLVGYYGVIPLRYVFHEFPEFTRFPAGYDKNLTIEDRIILARDFLNQQHLSAAKRQLKKALVLDKKNSEAWMLLGVVELLSGNRKGLAYLEKSLTYNPKNLEALVFLGSLYLELKDFVKSAEYVERALEAGPDDYQVHLLRGKIYLAVKRYKEAIEEAQKADQLAAHILPEPLVLWGKALYQKGDLEEGKKKFEEAIKANPFHIPAWLGLGKYYEQKNMFEAAIIEYGKLKRKIPRAYESYEAIGRCYQKLQEYEKSYQNYAKAIELCSKSGKKLSKELLYNTSWLAFHILKKNDLALKAMVRYLNLYGLTKGSHKGHLLAAQIYQGMNRFGPAFSHYSLAYAISPKNSEVEKMGKEIRKAPLGMNDLVLLSRLGYTAPLLMNLIRVTPLAFQITKKKEVVRLAKAGIDVDVILYILKIQKERKRIGQPVTPGGDGKRENPAPSTETNNNSVVGKWRGHTILPPQGDVIVVLFFRRNGKFFMGFYHPQTWQLLLQLSGTYFCQKNRIIMDVISPQRKRIQYLYVRQGNMLKIGSQGGWDILYKIP
ncbi:MAG: hypothetical protein D6785_07870 [Planctomycetota bacterium]|nr:MAG: hypothetical protein D6785_07870 [Planctomycetota bacterium]